MVRRSETRLVPCRGYATAQRYPDVEPEVLAREAANDPASDCEFGAARPVTAWRRYLQRVLPALERDAAGEMAEALLLTDHSEAGARDHVAAMRLRSIAAGDAKRVRFWGEVLEAIEYATG